MLESFQCIQSERSKGLFTGPIESLMPGMAASADLAIREVNESGLFLRGTRVEAVRADSTCTDA